MDEDEYRDRRCQGDDEAGAQELRGPPPGFRGDHGLGDDHSDAHDGQVDRGDTGGLGRRQREAVADQVCADIEVPAPALDPIGTPTELGSSRERLAKAASDPMPQRSGRRESNPPLKLGKLPFYR